MRAIVDRILDGGRFLTLDGPSMRTKHLGLCDPTSEGLLAVVNSMNGPVFSEPARHHRQHALQEGKPLDTALVLVDLVGDRARLIFLGALRFLETEA